MYFESWKVEQKNLPSGILQGRHSPSIIGLKTCERLDLIERVYLVNDVDPNLLEEIADTFLRRHWLFTWGVQN